MNEIDPLHIHKWEYPPDTFGFVGIGIIPETRFCKEPPCTHTLEYLGLDGAPRNKQVKYCSPESCKESVSAQSYPVASLQSQF